VVADCLGKLTLLDAARLLPALQVHLALTPRSPSLQCVLTPHCTRGGHNIRRGCSEATHTGGDGATLHAVCGGAAQVQITGRARRQGDGQPREGGGASGGHG
jgi:hypothetical protein